MKKLVILASLIFSTMAFAQEIEKDKEGYVEVPELTKAIKISGGSIDIKEVVFKYLPEYVYNGGIVYGSWIKMEMTGIDPVNTYNGLSYNLSLSRLTRLEDNTVVMFDDWDFGDDPGVQLDEGDILTHTDYLKIGEPYYSGDYLWEVEFADMCNNKKVSVSLKFKIVPNPCIKIETKGNAKIREAYLWNSKEKYVYANDKIYTGKLEFTLTQMSGFVVKDNIVKAGVELKIIDDKGEVLTQADDIATGQSAFQEVDEGGYFSITPHVTIGTEHIEKTLTFQARIWDKNEPKNEITTAATFFVRK